MPKQCYDENSCFVLFAYVSTIICMCDCRCMQSLTVNSSRMRIRQNICVCEWHASLYMCMRICMRTVNILTKLNDVQHSVTDCTRFVLRLCIFLRMLLDFLYHCLCVYACVGLMRKCARFKCQCLCVHHCHCMYEFAVQRLYKFAAEK